MIWGVFELKKYALSENGFFGVYYANPNFSSKYGNLGEFGRK